MYKKESFPRTFNEFIGNENTKKILKIIKENYLYRGRTLPNILLTGNPGLGKTTLAKILASECKVNFASFNGIQFSEDILKELILNYDNLVIFIDEIHSIEKDLAEQLFHLLQDGVFKYYNEQTEQWYELKVKVPIVGATTNPEKLLKPFRERFRYALTLEEYTDDELLQILNLYEKEYGVPEKIELTKEAKELLINISQGVPRLLENRYYSLLDLAINKSIKVIDKDIVLLLMELIGVDSNGLSREQQEYIKFLRSANRPVGLNALSAYLNIPEGIIKTIVEPYLVKKGLVIRTPRGRTVREMGEENV